MTTPKYNRTPHLPFSEGRGADDKVAEDVSTLLGHPIVITEKMDGGNASLERDNVFARTHAATPSHPSFDWLKAFHKNVAYKIPENIQIFGENMFALHSIKYSSLPSYFLVFAVRDLLNNTWANWEEVCLWAEEIGAPTAPILWRGTVKSAKELQTIVEDLAAQPSACGGEREGVVVRVENSFNDADFHNSVMKWVRKNHVQSEEHWKFKTIVKNGLCK